MKNIIELNDAGFKEAIASGVVLVDFWAPWCGPCRLQGTILESVAAKVDGKARIAKVNVDSDVENASIFGVQSIPTLILFKDGTPVREFIGVQTEQELLATIAGAVKSA